MTATPLRTRPATAAESRQVLSRLSDEERQRWAHQDADNPFGPALWQVALAGRTLVGALLAPRNQWRAAGRESTSIRLDGPRWIADAHQEREAEIQDALLRGVAARFAEDTHFACAWFADVPQALADVGYSAVEIRCAMTRGAADLREIAAAPVERGDGSGARVLDAARVERCFEAWGEMPDDRLHTVGRHRDIAWRFGEAHSLGASVFLGHGSAPRGAFAFGHIRRCAGARVLVVDALIAPIGAWGVAAAASALRRLVRRHPADAVFALAAPRSWKQLAFRAAGFRSAPVSGVWMVRRGDDPQFYQDPTNPNEWSLSAGDVL